MPLSPVSSTVDAGLAATLATICRKRLHRLGLRRRSRAGCRAALRWRAAASPRVAAASSRARARTVADHLVEVERLVGEVKGPELHRFDGRFDADEGCEQDHQDVGIELSSARAGPRGRRCRAGDSRAARGRHPALNCSSASLPVPASRTSYPSAFSRSRSDHRISSSSSTTRTVAFGICHSKGIGSFPNREHHRCQQKSAGFRGISLWDEEFSPEQLAEVSPTGWEAPRFFAFPPLAAMARSLHSRPAQP